MCPHTCCHQGSSFFRSHRFIRSHNFPCTSIRQSSSTRPHQTWYSACSFLHESRHLQISNDPGNEACRWTSSLQSGLQLDVAMNLGPLGSRSQTATGLCKSFHLGTWKQVCRRASARFFQTWSHWRQNFLAWNRTHMLTLLGSIRGILAGMCGCLNSSSPFDSFLCWACYIWKFLLWVGFLFAWL